MTLSPQCTKPNNNKNVCCIVCPARDKTRADQQQKREARLRRPEHAAKAQRLTKTCYLFDINSSITSISDSTRLLVGTPYFIRQKCNDQRYPNTTPHRVNHIGTKIAHYTGRVILAVTLSVLHIFHNNRRARRPNYFVFQLTTTLPSLN